VADDILPALILLYAQIDGIGALGRPSGAPVEPAGPNFQAWTTKYILDNGEVVTATDLWGARCAVLHTQTPDSRWSAQGTARPIRYRLRNTKALAVSPGTGPSLTIDPLNLARKVERGIEAWLRDVEQDAELTAAFCERAERIFDPSDIEDASGTSQP